MKIGIVGVGGMGSVHARHYAAMPGVELLAFDADAARLDAYAERFPVSKASSWADLVSRSEAIDVCLPTHLHEEFALASIQAGRPTLVEKPLARDVESCIRMRAAARAGNVPVAVGHVARFFPEHATVHRLIKEGQVGTPASARMRRGGAAPQGHEGWFRDASKSGGVILDLAIHDIDWLIWTLGDVKQVFARSVRLGPQVEGADFAGDYALVTMTHEGGAVSHVEATWMDPSGFRTSIEVSGSQGNIEWDSRQNPALRTALSGGVKNESPNGPGDDPYYKQLSAFVEAAAGRGEVAVGLDEALKAVAVCEAAIKSAEACQPCEPFLG